MVKALCCFLWLAATGFAVAAVIANPNLSDVDQWGIASIICIVSTVISAVGWLLSEA